MSEVTIRRLTGFGDGAIAFVLRMDTLPYKDDIRWTLITARCLATKSTRIDLFLQRGGTEHLLISKAVLDADDSVSIPLEVHAPGDFRVCARFNLPANTSECELYAYGVVQRTYPLE